MDLDLLEMITDPDLGGTRFWVGRALETVDKFGRSQKVEQLHSAEGNVQPAPGKERELLEEGERQKAAIQVFTPFDLTAGENATKADRIYYNGGVYKVSLAEPWREHAAFTKAVAVYERPWEGEIE